MVEGQRIGSYEILAMLGAGAMGEVYRARDLRLRRDVAIKVLSASFVSDPDRLHRFNREAQLLAALNHPHIAAIYSLEEFDGIRGLVLELVDGPTLAERLSTGPLPVREALVVAGQIAEALEAAHEKGILHRDLKPPNIKFTSQGAVKVLDFGLAKVLTDEDAAMRPSPSATVTEGTKHGVILGTTAYMSPEQVRGKPVDKRTDVWAFGCVLFEMLTSEPLFLGDTMSDTIAAILKLPPRWDALPAATPPRIRRILERCLEKDPNQRPRDLKEVRIEIEQAASQPTTISEVQPAIEFPAATPISTAAVAGRRRFRGRVVFVAATVVIAAFIAVLLWFSSSKGGRAGRDVPTIAVLPLVNLSGNPSNEYIGTAVAETLMSNLASLDAITVVSRAPTGASNGNARDLARIARDLGVNFVVDGGVQQNDQRLKVTARLVRADGSVVWGGSYDGTASDLFTIETQVAEQLTDALELRLTQTERAKLGRQPTTNIRALADYAQGRASLERIDMPGNLDLAIESLSAATEEDPGFALAYAALGEAYWNRYQQTKNPDWTIKAREAALEALRLDSNQSEVRRILALIYRGSGDNKRAMQELQKALESRNSDDAHRMIGEILSDQGQIDAAVAEFDQAIAIRPNFWGHYDAKGLALYRAGQFKEAAAAFERVTQLQPDNAAGFQRLGTAYHAAGDTGKAIVNYRRALDLAPTAKAYANLGFIYYEQGKFTEAADAYNQALKLDPASHVTYRNLADVYQRMGQSDKAREAYAKAIEIANTMLGVNPKDASTLSHRALYEAKLGNRAAAERDAQAAVTISPSDGQVLYNRAVVHAIAGEKQSALKVLEQALAHGASAAVARSDDDLRVVAGTPEFEKLTAGKH